MSEGTFDRASVATHSDEARRLGMDQAITRRDFIGASMIGAGAALLGTAAPGAAAQPARFAQQVPLPLVGLGPDWTGPGGVGDYARANGNTHEVVNDAHALRNRAHALRLRGAADSGESYDHVIIGAGFAGLAAAHTFRELRPGCSVLLLDNHAMFGGEAKQNEFEVDGYRLWGPQGSSGYPAPNVVPRNAAQDRSFWKQIGLPDVTSIEYQPVEGSDVLVPRDVWRPMHAAWEEADHGWFLPGTGWIRNPWIDGLRRVPIADDLRRDLLVAELWRQPPRRPDWQNWLDSMTYAQFLRDVVGVGPGVADLMSPHIAVQGGGLGADVSSAFCALEFPNPGPIAYRRLAGRGEPVDYHQIHSFPGGNAGTVRKLVKALLPGALRGGDGLADVLFQPVDFDALDRDGERVRIRLRATAVQVAHEARATGHDRVRITYLHGGRLHRVRAGAVVMAGGQWMNKHVLGDAPAELTAAMHEFHHAPILTINVAIRHWRFLDRLGIAAARWFDGFGWFTSLRRQMMIEGRAPMPLHPDKPTVLTLFVPFLSPGSPVAEQAVAARMQLFGLSYADIEFAVRRQFDLLFGASGFDAARDIAGITTNRWGHAYVVQPPGFYFGRDGRPPPREIVRRGYGRIGFAHSELQGAQSWPGAVEEGQRAARALLDG